MGLVETVTVEEAGGSSEAVSSLPYSSPAFILPLHHYFQWCRFGTQVCKAVCPGSESCKRSAKRKINFRVVIFNEITCYSAIQHSKKKSYSVSLIFQGENHYWIDLPQIVYPVNQLGLSRGKESKFKQRQSSFLLGEEVVGRVWLDSVHPSAPLIPIVIVTITIPCPNTDHGIREGYVFRQPSYQHSHLNSCLRCFEILNHCQGYKNYGSWCCWIPCNLRKR